MDIDINKIIDANLNDAKKKYIKYCISQQIYRAFLKHYKHVVEQDSEALITSYICDNVDDIIDVEKESIDPEWTDYYLAYVSGINYNFEIVNSKAMADFINSKYLAIKMDMDDGQSYDVALANSRIRTIPYSTIKEVAHDKGKLYYDFTIEMIKDAVDYIKAGAETLAEFTGASPDDIRLILENALDVYNPDFMSIIRDPNSQVVIDCEDKYFLSAPNLVMASLPFIYPLIDTFCESETSPEE